MRRIFDCPGDDRQLAAIHNLQAGDDGTDFQILLSPRSLLRGQNVSVAIATLVDRRVVRDMRVFGTGTSRRGHDGSDYFCRSGDWPNPLLEIADYWIFLGWRRYVRIFVRRMSVF